MGSAEECSEFVDTSVLQLRVLEELNDEIEIIAKDSCGGRRRHASSSE